MQNYKSSVNTNVFSLNALKKNLFSDFFKSLKISKIRKEVKIFCRSARLRQADDIGVSLTRLPELFNFQ